MYLEIHSDKKVSYSKFMQEFKKYKVSIYVPRKDTCAKCDSHEALRRSNPTVEQLEIMEKESQDHKDRVRAARQDLTRAKEASKTCQNTLFFTFDMEQNQPLPFINTSVAFYKRQLSMHNFGIHTLHNKQGHMCLWTEAEGKRGANEVASSLHSFLDKEGEGYENLVSFSDACGGQNRNKIVTAYFMYLCHTSPIKSWTHSFLESGHTFLPNDTDFGKIEKKKKDQIGLYCFEDYVSLIKKCKFNVIRMENKFKDFAQLTNILKFRKFNESNAKFSWLQLKKLRVTCENFVLQYKYSCREDEQWQSINLSNLSTDIEIDLAVLYPNGIKVKNEKYRDIMSLLPYIPSVHHDFFLKLKNEESHDDELEEFLE